MTQSRRFGPYQVTRVVDGVYRAPVADLAHVTTPDRAVEVARRWGKPTIDVPVNLFLLSGPGGLTLIDAGAGEAWGPAYGQARAMLAALGVAPCDVRRVLLTHLHGDHALGLLDGEARFFPNAEIFAPADDLAFFTDSRARAATPANRAGAFAVAAKLTAVYGDALRSLSPGAEPIDDLVMMTLPGHTPGHAGFVIGRGETAGPGALFLMGDALHAAALQPADPDLGFVYDIDPPRAGRTRRGALDLAARRGWIVSGGHIDGFMRVEAQGEAWRMSEA